MTTRCLAVGKRPIFENIEVGALRWITYYQQVK